MTLKTKICLSTAFAITLSLLLSLVLTWNRVNSFIFTSEEDHFTSMAQTVDNDLESSFEEYLRDKVNIVVSTKTHLYDITSDARRDITVIRNIYPPSANRKKLLDNVLANHQGARGGKNGERSTKILLRTAGQVLKDGIPEFFLETNSKNTKRQTIKDVIKKMGPEGNFTLWPISGALDSFALLYFLPVKHTLDFSQQIAETDEILISGVFLHSLFSEAERVLNERVRDAKKLFENIRFYDRAVLLLCDTSGNIIVSRGNTEVIRANIAHFIENARKSNSEVLSVETTEGTYLARAAWIQSYKWCFIIAAPLDVLRAPSASLISALFIAGLFILAAALAVSIIVLVRALRPLDNLLDCTRQMAVLDLSSQENLLLMEQLPEKKLNLSRHDEIGDLSRSFAKMSHELAKNIRSTMRVMTEQKRMEGELSAARDIQQGILPNIDDLPTSENVTIAAFLEQARAVGGDLYDVFSLDENKIAIIIGDVSGKGIPAALFMTMSLTLSRYALKNGLSPEKAMASVNTHLEQHNPGLMFVTLFIATYDQRTGAILYANGGHCQPILMDKAGKIRKLENLSGPIVGAMPDLEYTAFTDTLAPGETCLLYSDGLTEAMNPVKELYGEERVFCSLQAHRSESPKELLANIYADICAFRGTEPPSDDLTMFALTRTKDIEEKQKTPLTALATNIRAIRPKEPLRQSPNP